MIRWTVLGAALLVAACSSANEDSEDAPKPVALVTLAPVRAGAAGQALVLYGAAEAGPAGKISLVAPAETSVADIVAPVGTRVTQGQVIVHLAPSTTLRADAAKAVSDAVAADKALARAVRLRAGGLGSDADVETARAAATAADALRDSFAAKTDRMTVRAPMAGVVDSVGVSVGDLLQPGAAVASVSRMTDLRARLGTDPETARAVKPGMAVRIAHVGGSAISTRVQSISPVVDPQSKLASIFAALPPRSGIAPGEAITATIALGGRAGALSIPYAALLNDAGQPYVYVVSGGTAHRRDIETQASAGDRVTVIKGLRDGEQLVVQGVTAIDDGMKVRTR